MNDMDAFSFEESAWELFARKLKKNDRISAVRFLTLLEEESEEAVEDAFLTLQERTVSLDLTGLPAVSPDSELGRRLALEKRLAEEDTLLNGLEKDDPLNVYLQELAQLPAAGDPVLLAELAAQGDEASRNMLVNASLHRVIALARELAGRGVLLQDLIQEGSLGLWQSILSFEGGDFEQTRDWWIRHYMEKALVLQARQNGVGQKMRQALENYRLADRALLARLGRSPTLEEMAQELNVTPEAAALVEEMFRSAKTSAKAKEAPDPEQEAEEESRHVEDTAYFQSRQRILELLSTLSEQEAKLLTLRFGLEGGVPLSPEDTGKRLGLTAREVVAMEAVALMKLRQES